MTSFSDLFPALVECFAIILFGYISGRLNIISPAQGKGIGTFVGTFALPALLFKSMVELDFATVSWSFMVAVLLGKTIVFVIVLIFSLVLVKPHGTGRASLYAIFSTQSNDFALGYPLIQALYSKSHPEFLQYIYLIAPISLLILNPIGFLLLEIDKVRRVDSEYMELPKCENGDNGGELVAGKESINGDKDNSENSEQDGDGERGIRNNDRTFTKWTCFNIFKGVILNPLVFMVFIGLIGHFIFNGVLPQLIENTLSTLANTFSGAALFYLGLTMVGKISQQKGIGLIIPASLIAAKVILLPILIRQLVISFSNVIPVYRPDSIARNSTNMTDYILSLADFGYLYGTFPTAPTVVIYAAKYGIEVDRLATGMVFCTSLSAPIMYVSAWTLSMGRMSVEFFRDEVQEVDKDISIISLFCSIWCIVIFIIGRKFLNVPHAVTFSYMFAVLFTCIGTILWDSVNLDNLDGGVELFIFGLMFFAIQSSRLLTASLAVSMVGILTYGQRWMWKNCSLFISLPYILSFLVTVVLMSSANHQDTKPVRIFAYGQPQYITSFVVILTAFLVTLVCLFIIMKKHGYRDHPLRRNESSGPRDPENDSLLQSFNESCDSSSTEEEDNPQDYKKRKCCVFFATTQRFGSVQKTRHIVLLLLLMLSMFIALCLVIWKMTSMKQVGIYFELSFLDSVFNFGQGFFVFCVFGLDSDLIIDPFVRLWRKLRYGSEDISLMDLSMVDREDLLKCLQFTKHHLDDCMLDIQGERQSGLTVHQDVFTGKDFCTWVIDRGLVHDRAEACDYGKSLMLGRVLNHHKNKHYFHDLNYLYRFEEPKRCLKKGKVRRVTDTEMGSSFHSTNHPCTSTSLRTPLPASLPVRAFASPAKRWFHGYSFEAYLLSSDTESQFSPRKAPLSAKTTNKDDHITVSVNNNCNQSASSTNDSPVCKPLRKKKSITKSRKVGKTVRERRHFSSDSSA